MKYRFLLIIFNIVLIVSFLFIFLLPSLLFEPNLMPDLWKHNSVFLGLIIILCILVNVGFFLNAAVFAALEKEEWPQLALVLERKVYNKNNPVSYYVTLLCNTYMLTSNMDGLKRLELYLAEKNSAAFAENLPRFATLAILQKDFPRVRSLAAAPAAQKRCCRDWMRWYAGFSFYLEKNFDASCSVFGQLLLSCRESSVAALCVYLLETQGVLTAADACATFSAEAASVKKELQKKIPEKWLKQIESEKRELYGAAISPLLDEIVPFLFPNKKSTD